MSSLPPPSTEEIARDARWLVQALDPASQGVRLIAMDEEAYRAASFLDDRMLQAPRDFRVVPWVRIADSVPQIGRTDARWIFHIGHVGSTLIARLLGELTGVLSVREPRFLRDIAVLPSEHRGEFSKAAPALFSRTFRSGQLALVKATSFASEIATELMGETGRAIFMYATAPQYIASILAGPASLQELAAYASSREKRSAGRIFGLPADLPTQAHQAAAAWACEMSSLEAAAEGLKADQVRWMDFDRALEDLRGALETSTQFFGFDASAEEIDGIATGPLTRRYSKAVEHGYTPALRREVIAEAAQERARDISDALAMLEDAAQESPLLARALQRSTSEA